MAEFFNRTGMPSFIGKNTLSMKQINLVFFKFKNSFLWQIGHTIISSNFFLLSNNLGTSNIVYISINKILLPRLKLAY
ncbi:hypothetical protein BVAF_380 [Candidatus Blochmanniella vafra str. BVAF]|uniref:Uncharacterized protein n=1 Tax=Blochmanniella vafra (strain BVAF) TaxID=859654 RepID=E8Q679_BLOVB|nr:hypothetical protein BVAF_380 [Candidatus Blochmannia vafer str. BVAF]